MESDHINVLKTGTAEERIFLLQKLAKSDKSQITEEILNTITELSADADIGVKFWAKKTLAKFQPANRIISSDDNSKSLPISMLLQKLDSASGSSSFQ